MSEVLNRVAEIGVVPVIAMNSAEQALPLADALLAGGLPVVEITFRTQAAAEVIRLLARERPELIVGAGTVVNVQQVHDAVEAGAKFLVSPGSDAEVIAEAIKLGVPITPGVVTPSEIMIGLKLGLKVFKFFPAENYGGLKTIKALSGPFPQIKILPTGGINQNNAAEYFKNPKIVAVGGSWMCTKDMISAGDFDAITEKSRAATDLFKEIRG